MSNAEYAGQPAWKIKELTLQIEVDALGCFIVDGARSRSECLDFVGTHLHSGWMN